MIKAKGHNGKGKPVLLLGLSHGNLDRLRAKEPIRFDGTPFGFPGDVVIMAGETEESIALEIANPSTKMFRI